MSTLGLHPCVDISTSGHKYQHVTLAMMHHLHTVTRLLSDKPFLSSIHQPSLWLMSTLCVTVLASQVCCMCFCVCRVFSMACMSSSFHIPSWKLTRPHGWRWWLATEVWYTHSVMHVTFISLSSSSLSSFQVLEPLLVGSRTWRTGPIFSWLDGVKGCFSFNRSSFAWISQ